jgi:hypothetical protein
MQGYSKKITVELNEHDILSLINLLRREINDTETVWRPYWQQLVKKIQTDLERDINKSNHNPHQE